MHYLEKTEGLSVEQIKEWGEILTGFETKNKYTIRDLGGRPMFEALEESPVWSRWLLSSLRPFTLHLWDHRNVAVLELKRPFRFYFGEIRIADQRQRPMGKIKRKFSMIRRKFSVQDRLGREKYEIIGPFFHPWTFNITQNGFTIGKITKRWSGLGKEMFTDADNFQVQFPPKAGLNDRCLFIGALFLIDILFFENNNRR